MINSNKFIIILACLIGLLIAVALFLFFKGNTQNKKYSELKDDIELYRNEDKQRLDMLNERLNKATELIKSYQVTDSIILKQQKELLKIQKQNAANYLYIKHLPPDRKLEFFSKYLSEVDSAPEFR